VFIIQYACLNSMRFCNVVYMVNLILFS
jgi:hypothetical protein